MAEAAACDAALPLLQAALSAAGGVELHPEKFIWGFSINGGTPKWMFYFMENPIKNWWFDDLELSVQTNWKVVLLDWIGIEHKQHDIIMADATGA